MKIAMAAGEISGDLLAGSLVKALKELDPEIQIAGIAGPSMQQQGCEAWVDIDQLSVMGLSEILSQLPRLLRLRKSFAQKVLAWQPDIFVGIDAPDFNLALEKKLSLQGINTAHYVSPSVWAWRQSRVKKIKLSTRLMLTLFPFEQAFYQKHDVEAIFTGHPFADEIPLKIDRNKMQDQLGLTGQPLIALLPGSRSQEISRIAPELLKTAKILSEKYPQSQFVIPVPGNKQMRQLKQLIPDNSRFTLTTNNAREVLMAADLAILASGTVALEAMLCQCPMVVCYKLSPATAFIVRSFNMLKSQWVSLPNVLSDQSIVPELLQEKANAQEISLAAIQILESPQQQAEMLAEFKRQHLILKQNAAQQAAKSLIAFIKDHAN